MAKLANIMLRSMHNTEDVSINVMGGQGAGYR